MNGFKKFLIKLKDLWTIYGGITISTLIAWIFNFQKSSMDIWSSFFTLAITSIGLLTMIKIAFTKKHNKTNIESIAQKNVSQIKNALYPENSSQEIGKAIVYTVKEGKKIMKKIGKFFKWLWGNKLTLTSIISNLFIGALAQYVMYSDVLKDFAFFQENVLVCRIVVTILCVLWLINNIFTSVTKYGLENLNELKERSEQRKQEQLEKLSPEQKKTLKNTIKEFKDQIGNIDERVVEIGKELAKALKVVEDFKLLSNVVQPDAEKVNEYNTAQKSLQDLEQEKQVLANKKAQLENNIEKIKGQL